MGVHRGYVGGRGGDLPPSHSHGHFSAGRSGADDWHLHLRNGSILKSVLPYTSKVFGRAIIMPNLQPPITTVKDAEMYKKRITDACPQDHTFEPLMTLYLTEATDFMDLAEGFSKNIISAVKLYPAGATTNSSHGISDFKKLYKVFEKMEEIGCTLCIHGEVVDPNIDIFDREYVFIEKVLDPIVRTFPELKVIMEHVTNPIFSKTINNGVCWIFTYDGNPRFCIKIRPTIITAYIRTFLGIGSRFYINSMSV